MWLNLNKYSYVFFFQVAPAVSTSYVVYEYVRSALGVNMTWWRYHHLGKINFTFVKKSFIIFALGKKGKNKFAEVIVNQKLCKSLAVYKTEWLTSFQRHFFKCLLYQTIYFSNKFRGKKLMRIEEVFFKFSFIEQSSLLIVEKKCDNKMLSSLYAFQSTCSWSIRYYINIFLNFARALVVRAFWFLFDYDEIKKFFYKKMKM